MTENKNKWCGHDALRTQILESPGWLLVCATCGVAQVCYLDQPRAWSRDQCFAVAALQLWIFVTEVPWDKQKTYMEGREVLYIFCTWRMHFCPRLFVYKKGLTNSVCTGPPQFCELVLQAGMWMYEPVITIDPGFSRVTDAHGQALQSHRSGRCKGSKKDFRKSENQVDFWRKSWTNVRKGFDRKSKLCKREKLWRGRAWGFKVVIKHVVQGMVWGYTDWRWSWREMVTRRSERAFCVTPLRSTVSEMLLLVDNVNSAESTKGFQESDSCS